MFHLSDASKAGMCMNNVRNLLDEIGEINVEVEVVLNGEAVKGFVRGSEVEPKVKTLMGRGVRFMACLRALNAHNVDREDLIEGFSTVSAGIVELVKRQCEGWCYVRP